MRTGVYRKKNNGKLYQFLLLARNHYDGAQAVVYIPLRVEPEWAGTVRPCWIPRGDALIRGKPVRILTPPVATPRYQYVLCQGPFYWVADRPGIMVCGHIAEIGD